MTKQKDFLINDVLKTIAYFDAFKYPLTQEQVYRFLPRNSVTQQDISVALNQLVQQNILAQYDDCYCLPSLEKTIALQRKENELRALRAAKHARFVTRLLKIFPFVRAVFITGSLSKKVATKESDIDFLIVAAQQRLWICKTTLTLFRKIFLFGSSKYFCTNFYVTENHYAIEGHSIFSAIELVTTKAAWNATAFKEFLQANKWAKDFLPNFNSEIDTSFMVEERHSRVQKILEAILSIFPLTPIDNSLMNFHQRYWIEHYSYLNAEKRETLFRTSPDISSVWRDDHQTRILDRYIAKLADLGLQ